MSPPSAPRPSAVLLVALLALVVGTGAARTPESDVAPTAATEIEAEASERIRALQRELQRILPLRERLGTEWGVLVTSTDRGDTLFSHRPHRVFAPASNVKLLTTAAALHHLGPDYRYRTFLLSRGRIENGVLRGDLLLYGTGDPSFSSLSTRDGDRTLRELARTLREAGVRRVEGDVLGDGTYFPGATRPEGWSRRDLNDWFAAPVSGLSYNQNVTTIEIEPGAAAGAPLRVSTYPEGTPIPLSVTGRTVSGRPTHPVWAVREAPEDPVEIVGQLRTRSTGLWRRLTVNDPVLYAATRLHIVLEQEGIHVSGESGTVAEPSHSAVSGRTLWAPGLTGERSPRILAEHRSRPLVELLRIVNKQSHNLFAESILRTLGRVVEGDASFRGGARVVHRFLVDEAGVPAREARPADGSGLSHENRVSPYAFVRAMDFLVRSSLGEAFRSTLPEAGNYRELSRMYRSAAAGNLKAKTGTIEGVSALSGVVRASSGEELLFSIVSNDVASTSAAKRIEDRIGIRLAEFWRPSSDLERSDGVGDRD